MTDLAPEGASAVLDAVRRLLPDLAAGAHERDRDRLLPHAELRALSDLGAFAVTVPAEHGGPGGGAVEAIELTRLLATADPSIAQVPQSHFVYLRLVEIAGSPELRRRVLDDVLAGARVANAQSERGGRDITDIRTTIRDSADGPVVDGRKFYATGSLFASWLAVLARDLEGVDHVAFLPADTPGVTIEDDWAGFGQRTTGSGTVLLEEVLVDPELVAPRAEALTGPYAYGPYAQALHAAIDAGLARGALADAATFVRTRTRPWFESGVASAGDDPLLVQRFGELEVTVRAAESALSVGAEAVDRAYALRDPGLHAEASLAVAAAKVLADRAALEVTSTLFEVAGAASTDESLGLHRHWRNARTHTTHDPVRYKVQHLGRWALHGQVPPRHGVI
ncbi:SfnB family sulfur acquisition oxidoreductase [Aeromicrobium sp. Root495]|uniref:SfnB family sulfur acquisition oxidoreductase n=1 Tax=Aeromicrobium sp. Root495 TaxID=1736550 RepID=UPI0006FCFCF6|nr:SfnB family sulfur acquisition oxidoreductase [Aeromicrobium sp. Root495]KQY58454.1 SfnB family sulfur acquisition oxidoreductase [Aeromicrobium sp. Root495]